MIESVYSPFIHQPQTYPLFLSLVKAGFPSPADDYIEKKLDLNEYLIKHPSSTFFLKVDGTSMINAGISNGDILIVDRSIEAIHNKIVVVALNGEFTVKRLIKNQGKISLLAENPNFPPIEILDNTEFEVWGVVIHIIHSV